MKTPESILEVSRSLRKQPTRAEKIFWGEVSGRQVGRKRFLRQHPIIFELDGRRLFFVADFYCAEHKLVVEIDGRVHERQKDHDEIRDEILDQLGYRVMRFHNDEIENELNRVIATLVRQLS